ncbi:MAG: HPr(Ser) kinase/phosphatase [Thermoanaerobaculia bacterium]|nr:HPr(Ser) kinase/phosphatase [Thermoanaerobaculia bacterium]
MSEGELTVRELLGGELNDLEFRVVRSQECLDNRITNPRVQKPGLAFAGHYQYIKPGRVQIIGQSEIEFIATLDEETRRERIDRITRLEVPVFIVTKGLDPPAELLENAGRRGIPVLASEALSSRVIRRVSYFLEDHLVPRTVVHGVLLEIYGLGVLLVGESGVGKSECALDLITRGHSLVADDRVTIKRYPHGELVGFSEGALHHHMEVRGLGIVNIQHLFGLAAVRERRSIDLVVELESWDEERAYDRLGLDETVFHLLDTPCPYIKMPVALGRNLSILVEVAARNHVLKLQGQHSARTFALRLQEELRRKRARAIRGERPPGEPPTGDG